MGWSQGSLLCLEDPQMCWPGGQSGEDEKTWSTRTPKTGSTLGKMQHKETPTRAGPPTALNASLRDLFLLHYLFHKDMKVLGDTPVRHVPFRKALESD